MISMSEKSVALSVVIPVYNKRAYIRRALRSIRSQTHAPNEIIIVDDGSTDGSVDSIEQCENTLVSVLRQENIGVSAARNRGTLAAKSPWVAFLDADDEWHPEFLSQCTNAIVAYDDIIAVFTNVRRSDSKRPWLRMECTETTYIDNYFDVAIRNRGRGMTASSVVIRRDILIRVGGFPVGVQRGEDLDTWTRVALAGPVAFIPRVLAIYHRTPGSVTESVSPLRLPQNPWEHKVWPPDSEISEARRAGAAKLFQIRNRWFALSAAITGNGRLARRVLRERCALFPAPLEYVKIAILSYAPAGILKTLRTIKRLCYRRLLARDE